jgi:hypothetical protein
MFSLPLLEDGVGEDDERVRQEEIEREAKVDCAFLEKMLPAETRQFEPMKVVNPIVELLNIMDLNMYE